MTPKGVPSNSSKTDGERMDAYAPLLSVSLVSLGVCVASMIVARKPGPKGERWGIRARAAAVVTLILVALALSSHVAVGHPPGSDRALGVVYFVTEHLGAFLVGITAAVLLPWASR